jgi:hypothetical protein
MSAELEVPKASLEALTAVDPGNWDSWAHLDEDVRAIAAPVVAAELRRQADGLDGYAASLVPYGADLVREIAAGLRARAAELEAS